MRFEEFIHNADSVTQINCAWRIITLNKIVPNWIEVLFGPINFVRLKILHFDIFQKI